MRYLGFCIALLFGTVAASAAAQGGPRLTGAAAIAELQSASEALQARAAEHPGTPLDGIAQRLAQWRAALDKSIGADNSQPVELMDGARRAQAMRAHAAVLRTQAYLASCTHCLDGDAASMAQALASTVERLQDPPGNPSAAPPVIEAIEAPDGRAIFALRGGAKPGRLVLLGKNLVDAQCPDPQVVATDAQGTRAAVQPALVSAQPGRIELNLPEGVSPAPGSYVLHVSGKRKAFLVGCVDQPEAIGVLQIAPAPRFALSYTLAATCGAATPPLSGSLPELTAYGASQAQQVDADGCPDASGYALSAQVTYADGSHAEIGPIAQPADAGISAGLPGGLTLSWNPAVRQLVLRSAADGCKGFY
jgi:hypothetical protein